MEKLLEVDDLRTPIETSGGLVKTVDGISYDLHVGETIAIVGESGSGNSVGALSIMRLIPWPPGRIVSGSVRFAGRSLLKLGGDELRQIRGRGAGRKFREPMTSLDRALIIGRQLTESIEHLQKLVRGDATRRAGERLGMVCLADPERRLTQYLPDFIGALRGWPYSPAPRSRSPSSTSTCSAVRCATRSIQGLGRADVSVAKFGV